MILDKKKLSVCLLPIPSAYSAPSCYLTNPEGIFKDGSIQIDPQTELSLALEPQPSNQAIDASNSTLAPLGLNDQLIIISWWYRYGGDDNEKNRDRH